MKMFSQSFSTRHNECDGRWRQWRRHRHCYSFRRKMRNCIIPQKHGSQWPLPPANENTGARQWRKLIFTARKQWTHRSAGPVDIESPGELNATGRCLKPVSCICTYQCGQMNAYLTAKPLEIFCGWRNNKCVAIIRRWKYHFISSRSTVSVVSALSPNKM